jgi:aminoglycoside phosphotransferase (APT) family kinase protein
VLGLFAPARLRAAHRDTAGLATLALRGWEMFDQCVPRDVADAVLALLGDVEPLANALRRRPCTLAHGDLATVNMAFAGDDLVLLDWSMPTVAPGAVDVARFVAGCSSVVALGREELLAGYRRAAGPAYDDTAMRLALLSGLVWLGWNKALDATENPDPAIRVRERADLDWWVREARTTLESGAL